MSKRDRSRRPIWFLACSAILCALLAPAGVAQRSGSKPAAVNPKTTAVRAATAEVLRETSEVRELAVIRQVRSGAQSRAEIEQMLIRNLNESSTPEQMRASELTYKRLGLLPADFQLRNFIVKLLTEQVAGYYDPKTREFYLADWIDLDAQRPVIAHELTHALQDQHFDLRRFEKWPRHDSDAELAAHALIEGDAMVTMLQYVMRSPSRQLTMLKSLVAGGANSTEVYDKAPRVLRESIVFPYAQGSAFVGQLFGRGGWEMVSASYSKLPQSTEQILHPEKYFAGEAPRKVALKDVAAALGAGWRMVEHDVNGEWGYYLILDEHLKSKDISQRAAAGWDGDRFALFTGPRAGEALVAQKTLWDTERDAEEFFDAYALRTIKRYGSEPVAREDEKGYIIWKTEFGTVLLERAGKSVLVLEGVPAGVDALAIARGI